RTATCAPSSRKRSTRAQPRPEPPPVISATSPCSQPMITLLPSLQTIDHLQQSLGKSGLDQSLVSKVLYQFLDRNALNEVDIPPCHHLPDNLQTLRHYHVNSGRSWRKTHHRY